MRNEFLYDGFDVLDNPAKIQCRGETPGHARPRRNLGTSMPWPTLDDEKSLPLDLLLATDTDPQIGLPGTSGYPSAEDIADAWKSNPKYAYYFHYNRPAGIETADDGKSKNA
jgi:hypothetical protein